MRKTSDRPGQFERGYRILQYLKKHTDKDHPVEQRDLRSAELGPFMGSRETYNSLIHCMADTLNRGLPEEEWQIVFDRYLKAYGTNPQEDDEESDDFEDDAFRIRNLYYQPIFTYEEIDAIIDGIQFSKTLGKEARETIIKKIEKHLTNAYYKEHHRGIESVREPVLVDREQMQENLSLIRDAIAANKKISFQFNGYNREKKLVPAGARTSISPYYIVANGGRYYLIGVWDARENTNAEMCIYRIDLITEAAILPEKRLPVRDVSGLPQTWNEEFALSHLNMAYDTPIPIKLKITCEDNKWTFLHDWFGDNFNVWHENIVTVKCSPFAMVNWALQYSDRVEVLHPEHVRQQVAEKVRELKEKYGV